MSPSLCRGPAALCGSTERLSGFRELRSEPRWAPDGALLENRLAGVRGEAAEAASVSRVTISLRTRGVLHVAPCLPHPTFIGADAPPEPFQ